MEKYNTDKLETGDLLICHADRLVSRLIKLVTGSYWTHTGNFIWLNGKPFVVEAQKNGVGIIPWEKWIEKYNYKFIVRRYILIGCHTRWSKRALSVCGSAGYDFVSFITKHPWYILTGRWQKKGNEYERMICSEFSMWTYNIAGAYKMVPKNVEEETNNKLWTEIEFEA